MIDHRTWRKSSYSGQENACVEVASASRCTAVRDSKDPNGPVLVFGQAAFTALLGSIKAGRLDPR
ncbi:hypothetical protein GCM10012275_06450 [Longimycelium tulufanense]|uniref:DUF397 domain-containing protein n=1 Tax=Longimycelium tulufanense TaxID=907463 RepID=A0A8J3C7Y9_9PSEU|nr:DUF397 domain-containing protein [Longimycelium tulufanense]GGM38117.1 hypothetical protein GCM10012275_06450 [Longimycelium tulufanense]